MQALQLQNPYLDYARENLQVLHSSESQTMCHSDRQTACTKIHDPDPADSKSSESTSRIGEDLVVGVHDALPTEGRLGCMP